MTELLTVPTFLFDQGDVFEGAEPPILVSYWKGIEDCTLITLKQGEDEINFTDLDVLKKLVKEASKHLETAKWAINRK